jgi:hypothetical protein
VKIQKNDRLLNEGDELAAIAVISEAFCERIVVDLELSDLFFLK